MPQIHRRIISRPVEKIVEEVIEIPKVVYEEEVVHVPNVRSVVKQKYETVPNIVERVKEVEVEIEEEEVVEVPKMVYEEEVIERRVPGKINFETKYVDKPLIQKRQKRVLKNSLLRSFEVGIEIDRSSTRVQGIFLAEHRSSTCLM